MVAEDGQVVELDALLLCDRKGVGQQMAAQAGTLHFENSLIDQLSMPRISNNLYSYWSGCLWYACQPLFAAQCLERSTTHQVGKRN